MTEKTKTNNARVESGRRGGTTTKARYGAEFYARIGRLGGRRGGETTKERYGIEHYRRIGRLGGRAGAAAAGGEA